MLAHGRDDTGAVPAEPATTVAATEVLDEPASDAPTAAAGPATSDGDAPRTDAGDEAVRYVHSPFHLAHLIVLGVSFVALVAATRVLPRTFVGLDVDASAIPDVSPSTVPFLTAYVVTAAAGFLVAAVAISIVRRRMRHAAVIATTFVLAGTVAYALFVELATGRPYDRSAPTMVAVAAAAVAVLTLVSNDLPRRLVRGGWWALLPPALLVGAWSGATVAAELLAVVGGATIGALVAYVAGTPSGAATTATVRHALEQSGFPVDEVTPHDVDARASVPWLATLATGRRVFVKTHTADERSADLLFRTWRALRLRRSDDGRPDASLRRAVEHEAFVATRAGSVGVRTPRLVGLGRIGDGGMFAAYEVVDGRTFEEVGEDLREPTLRSVWSMTRAMHRLGIAHRDLRSANLLVDGDDEAWVVDFGFAELAATPQQLRVDVVELVASTSTVVGTDRAVQAAIDVLGPEAVADALPLLQPAAVSTATRKALGKDGFVALRRALVEATGVPEPDEPKLERIQLKTIAMVVALGVAVWILLPQILDQGDLLATVRDADPWWVAVAVAASVATYVATAVSLLGATSTSVGFLPTIAAQVASSFTNRITPANVGGMALNTRYLARAGAGTTGAVTAVGVSTTAGGAMHLTLTVFALAWAGSAGLGGFSLPEPRTMMITGGIVAVLVAIGFVVPRSRRFLQDNVAGRVRESAGAVAEVARQPRKLVMLFGGSAAVTIANLVALYAAVAAFGVAPAVSTIAVVYLAGSTIGAAAPTPSGLGALEAALVAGLIATGVADGAAVAAVLLFRLATFWLPILPGWLSFVWLERAGRI